MEGFIIKLMINNIYKDEMQSTEKDNVWTRYFTKYKANTTCIGKNWKEVAKFIYVDIAEHLRIAREIHILGYRCYQNFHEVMCCSAKDSLHEGPRRKETILEVTIL